jgi:gluconolactonase
VHVDNLAHREAAFASAGIGWSGGIGDIIYKWNSSIIPDGSTVKKLSSNQFIFTEGPVWYNDSILLFTDDGLGSPDIFQYNPADNHFSTWPNNATHCLGLTCDKEGNLIGCSSNILMMNKTGQVNKTLTSGYNGKPFDNPNDLIADKKGGIYFTDPDYGLTTPPQDKTAVYYIDPTGNVIRVIDDLVKPNGLVLSPDGTKLYVVDAGTIYVYSWDVASDGSVSGKSTFAQLQTNNGVAGGDGMAIDINGNIYVATELGIQIFSAQGAAITTIVLPEMPSNCDFGGKDFKTLYITARTNLYSIDLNYPGFAVSRGSNPNRVNSISYQPLDKLYPNPVKDKFTIELTALKEKTKLSIFNINGQEVMEQQITDIKTEIDVSNLPTGLYFLRLKNCNLIETGKIVKE